jgi:hypothetical protein
MRTIRSSRGVRDARTRVVVFVVVPPVAREAEKWLKLYGPNGLLREAQATLRTSRRWTSISGARN